MASTLQLLRDMIAIPSVNPMRAKSGESVEKGMANFIETILSAASIDCERQTVVEGRDNVIAVVHSTGSNANGLMLNSHMDTVPVDNMSIKPFVPVIENGRVYGRGSCDAKASIAAMLSAVIEYANQPERPAPVVFAAMADEEFAFSGSWKLIEKSWPVSACVVGEPTLLRRGIEGGKYCVIFDPLDGSSNLDVCVGVGTIFSILRNDPRVPGAVETLCQAGSQQLAAGYILYGSSTVFVLTTGKGVDMFVLDPNIGSFVLVNSQIRIPATGKTYSVNEANRDTFPAGFGRYLDWAHGHGYTSRYIGSMVADVHRTLLKGGVFLYPPTRKNPVGKLRLMYEANPIAMIVEQAGGAAICGAPNQETMRILDIQPTSIHQRTSLVVGSRDEVAAVSHHLTGEAPG